jgi:transposase
LVPTLRPGQVVILDNLGAHRARDVRTVVEGAGATLCFLPAYSPDFNPIELAFGKLKTGLNRAQARTRAKLDDAIAAAAKTITTDDAHAFFGHCGFALPGQPF